MDRVLIVEDHKEWLDILREELETVGYQVATATTLGEALTLLQKETYHVVVTDISLTEEAEDIGGIKLLQWIQANSPATRALAISGRSVSGLDKERFKEDYRVLDYIERHKFDPDEFVELVGRAAAESKQVMLGKPRQVFQNKLDQMTAVSSKRSENGEE